MFHKRGDHRLNPHAPIGAAEPTMGYGWGGGGVGHAEGVRDGSVF